jgi:hypothetical protein
VTWTELSQLLTPVGVLAGVWVSYKNGKKLNEVHRTTNSLAQRNEEIAKQLGVKEGIEQQKANPTP